MPKKAKIIEATEKQKEILTKLSKSTHTAMHIKVRSQIILDSLSGMTNTDISIKNNIYRKQIGLWKNKWEKSYNELCLMEKEQSSKLKSQIILTLSDEYRSGRKARITEEQRAQIISLSLQSPDLLGVPLSHWTSKELAKKAIELKIVDTISPSQVSVYLKKYGHKNSSV